MRTHTLALALLPCLTLATPGLRIGSIAKSLYAPDRCNVEMQDADVQSVIKGLAIQHKKNVIFATEIKAKRTLSLHNMPFENALTQLVKYDGMLWHKDSDVYVVGTKSKLDELFPPPPKVEIPLAAPETVTQMFHCRNVKASEAVELLGKLYGEKSGLILAVAPGPILPALSNASSVATGISAQPLQNGDTEKGDARRIFLRGPKDLVVEAVQTLQAMDKPRKQVNIAVSIRDVSDDTLRELGINWSWSAIGLREAARSDIKFGKYSRQPFNIDAILTAIDSDTRTKVLASPNVSVIDGEKAFVLIGQRLNFPVLVGYSNANTPIFSKQEERVGIYLQVSALISEEGMISLTLYPQVSSVTSFLQINGGSYPQITTREAQTTLRVKNGEPIVIGGLIKQEEISLLEKVPGLGDIPLFGELFRHRKKTKVSSQVVIVITPVVLPEPGE